MLLECLFFDLENESNKMKKVYKGEASTEGTAQASSSAFQ